MRAYTKTAFPDAIPSNIWVKLHPIAARLFRASSTLRNKVANAGDIADFVDWQVRSFSDQPVFFGRREHLWERIAQHLDRTSQVVVLEFGVAWGYATDWWLTRFAGRDVVWHGFDLFTGNQLGYRQLDKGAFDAGGKPPAIDDTRVRWHIGDVKDTLGEVDLTASRAAQWLVLFDMGFYEPTAFAWQVISQHLQPGDILFFDEAALSGERRVLDEMIMCSTPCETIGATPTALGLVVTGPIR